MGQRYAWATPSYVADMPFTQIKIYLDESRKQVKDGRRIARRPIADYAKEKRRV